MNFFTNIVLEFILFLKGIVIGEKSQTVSVLHVRVDSRRLHMKHHGSDNASNVIQRMDAFAFHQFHQFFGQGIACAQVDEVVGSDLYGAAPAMMNSRMSSAPLIPPIPTTGMDTDRAT